MEHSSLSIEQPLKNKVYGIWKQVINKKRPINWSFLNILQIIF